jgi:hypothetical protein
MTTAYHYTSDSIWQMIQAGYFVSSDKLVPYKRLDSGVLRDRAPDFAKEKYLFAFLDYPEPELWKSNPEFPDLWRRIMEHIMHEDFLVRLLQFEVTPEDNAFVVDWAHMERVRDAMDRGMCIEHTGNEKNIAVVMDATDKYIDSRVPLADYDGNFTLPELVIANPIPLERVSDEMVMFDF